MQINYKKEDIGNGLIKVVINDKNDECAITGDKKNISTLLKMFDNLGPALTPAMIYYIDKISQEISGKQKTLQSKDQTIKQENAEKKYKIDMPSDVIVFLQNFFNENIILESSLSRITAEEIYVLARQYCDKKYFDYMPPLYRKKVGNYNKWFKEFFGDHANATNKNCNAISYYIKGRIVPTINPKNFMTNNGRTKYLIDKNGGLKFLYTNVKNGKSMREIVEIVSNKRCKATQTGILRYLALYGFDSMGEWDLFIDQFSSWKKCKKALLKRGSSND